MVSKGPDKREKNLVPFMAWCLCKFLFHTKTQTHKDIFESVAVKSISVRIKCRVIFLRPYSMFNDVFSQGPASWCVCNANINDSFNENEPLIKI